MMRKHRDAEQTEEEKARLRAIRERFQRDRPSPESLVVGGEYDPPVPAALYFEVQALVKELRTVREAAGLSLTAVAQRAGVDEAGLTDLEGGRYAGSALNLLTRYAAAVGKRISLTVTDPEPASR
jgi:hypothetical protein